MLSLSMKRGNSPLIIVVVVFVIAIVAGAFYFLNNSQDGADTPLPTLGQTQGNAPTNTNGEEMAEGSRYVMYDKAGYGAIEDSKHVLYFYANWCPTCRPVDAELQSKSAQIPEDIVVVRVNYNDSDTDADEEALASEHGITYQHTFVLMENGQEVTRWNGGGLSEIISRI